MDPVALLDAAGRRRSAATMHGHRRGQPPRNKGMRYPADPPTVAEIVLVMRHTGDRPHGRRLRGLQSGRKDARLGASEKRMLAAISGCSSGAPPRVKILTHTRTAPRERRGCASPAPDVSSQPGRPPHRPPDRRADGPLGSQVSRDSRMILESDRGHASSCSANVDAGLATTFLQRM